MGDSFGVQMARAILLLSCVLAHVAAMAAQYPTFANFTSSGTFTVTCSTCMHTVFLVGGGAAGAGCGGLGAGGGGGGVVLATFMPASAGLTSATVTVGAGSVGTNGGPANGGSTSFIGTGVSLTALGGGAAMSADSGHPYSGVVCMQVLWAAELTLPALRRQWRWRCLWR